MESEIVLTNIMVTLFVICTLPYSQRKGTETDHADLKCLYVFWVEAYQAFYKT